MSLDLLKYKFPTVSDADRAFPTFDTIPELLVEAKERGFDRYNATPYNKLFNNLFFSGGKINYKKELPEEFIRDCSRYLFSYMGSFAPKHEHKEAVCSMLLSELVELPKD